METRVMAGRILRTKVKCRQPQEAYMYIYMYLILGLYVHYMYVYMYLILGLYVHIRVQEASMYICILY